MISVNDTKLKTKLSGGIGRSVKSYNDNNGFTLIELIVVIALISTMFMFSVPNLLGRLDVDSSEKFTRWIETNVRHLKVKAVKDQREYTLNINVSDNIIWISDEGMDDEALENAKQKSLTLADDIRIIDVQYPETIEKADDKTVIVFHKEGYSDMAAIHLEDSDGDKMTYIIEPFLPDVKIFYEYVGFENYSG